MKSNILCLCCNLSKFILLLFIHTQYVYFISAAVILLAPLALMVHFSLPYNRAGRDSVLYCFILVYFKVFCGLNILFVMPVIFK